MGHCHSLILDSLCDLPVTFSSGHILPAHSHAKDQQAIIRPAQGACALQAVPEAGFQPQTTPPDFGEFKLLVFEEVLTAGLPDTCQTIGVWLVYCTAATVIIKYTQRPIPEPSCQI